MRTMNVTIIYPPVSNATSSPPPSLAALKAYICHHSDVSVEVRDFNVEFFRFFWNNLEIIRPILEDHLEEQFESKSSNYSAKPLSVLLHLYLPLLDNLKTRDKSSYSYDLLTNLLGKLIHEYYTSDLLADGYFLRCDYSKLSQNMNNYISDPIITQFIHSSSIKKPQILCFSLLAESQLPYAILFSRIFKISYPYLIVVAGGPYISEILTQPAYAKELFKDFDYLVAQEGESALVSIIESLKTDQTLLHPNVFTRSNLEKRTFFVEPIESLPTLDFKSLDLNLYFTDDLSLPIYTSKGCTWCKCKFCSQNSIFYRERTIKTAVSDLCFITQQTKVAHFQITDENIVPSRLKELSEEILKRRLNIRWFIQIRFDEDLDHSLLKLMKRAGCYAIEFGLESGSPEVLRKIRKGINLKTVERILKDCADLDYSVILNCIVGFPDETTELAEQTVSFLDSITKNIPNLRVKCNTQTFKIYPNASYASTLKVNFSTYPLSTVADWQEPDWLNEFQRHYGDHIIFSSKVFLPQTETIEKTHTIEDMPVVTLSPDCYILEDIMYDFTVDKQTAEPHTYLVILQPEMIMPNIFFLNDTMMSIVDELKNGVCKLNLLRQKFFNRYNNNDTGDLASAFQAGLMRLNNIGAILVC